MPRTIPAIWLIPEDKTGFYVFQAILSAKGINAHLKLWGEANGISRLANQLEDLIKIALRRKAEQDCIVVLHDTDDSVQANRLLYDAIKQICEREEYQPHVTEIVAVEEIEAWLLADGGFCDWLKIPPRAADNAAQPSKVLEQLLNKHKKKMVWNDDTKQKVIPHMDASGDLLSPSMREAMQTFLSLPCTQANP